MFIKTFKRTRKSDASSTHTYFALDPRSAICRIEAMNGAFSKGLGLHGILIKFCWTPDSIIKTISANSKHRFLFELQHTHMYIIFIKNICDSRKS